MRKFFVTAALLLPLMYGSVQAQLPPVFDKQTAANATGTPTTRKYLPPVRIVWQEGNLQGVSGLMQPCN